MMVWANYYKIAPYILIVIVLTAIVLIVKKRPKPLIGTVLTYPALWFVVMICSVVVQNFIVRPNEASIERAYIKNNIEYTNRALSLIHI